MSALPSPLPITRRSWCRDNAVHNNFNGIEVPNAATVQHNRIYSNTNAGINITSANGSQIRDNQVYSNVTGIIFNSAFTNTAAQIRNNVIYSNSNIGIDVLTGTVDHWQYDPSACRNRVALHGQWDWHF